MNELLLRLRDETRPHHIETEQLLYTDALRSGTLSTDQYRHLLLTHGVFHQALEAAIDNEPAFFSDYRPDTRRKTEWLRADLETVQLSLPAFPQPVFSGWSPVQLLGAAYVGEGSMLGGKTVWHYLEQSEALQPLLHSARFYRGYGMHTGPLWREFGEFAFAQGAPDADAVVAAAQQAFDCYRKIFGYTAPQVFGHLPADTSVC
ncbi:biliverdin-producing heme oxygenase [Rudanella lutea]|jgi:heme oxygenase|uniref:biliverdin-producing heme oxygenase n=1 Tax=Rudanella lutea TaxID=451374 RepID=UPI0003613699|nr:biliverdin-producing heme oxygenase [Rudanella lutea]